MFANFHTHTTRCKHATGTEREYIEEFIKRGVKVLGFSDHTPQFYLGDYSSWFRVDFDQVEDYFFTLNCLKKEYEKDIKIFIGFEAEYYPETFDKLMKFYEEVKPDFLILGQHALYNEREGIFASTQTSDEKYLSDYTSQVVEALEKGIFSYIAHPDIMNFVGNDKLKEEYFSKIAKSAKEFNIPLEINLLGLMSNRNYPSDMLYRVAKKYENQMIYGVDAHNLDIINRAFEIEGKADSIIKDYNLTLAKELRLFNGTKVKIVE